MSYFGRCWLKSLRVAVGSIRGRSWVSHGAYFSTRHVKWSPGHRLLRKAELFETASGQTLIHTPSDFGPYPPLPTAEIPRLIASGAIKLHESQRYLLTISAAGCIRLVRDGTVQG